MSVIIRLPALPNSPKLHSTVMRYNEYECAESPSRKTEMSQKLSKISDKSTTSLPPLATDKGTGLIDKQQLKHKPTTWHRIVTRSHPCP